MSNFVIVAIVLLIGVLIFLLRPLLSRKDEAADGIENRAANLAVLKEQRQELEQQLASGVVDRQAYELAREELERRTLEDVAGSASPQAVSRRNPKVAIGLGLSFIALIVALYAALGPNNLLSGDKPKANEDGSHPLTQEQILGMVERLSEKLQANPNDGAGWLMLGRSYAVLGRFPESAAAYGRAVAMLPPNAQNFADFADIVAMNQGKRLQGEPENLVRRALEIDPVNVKALALSGTLAFERQDFRAAIGEWRKVLANVPADSPIVAGMQGSIRDAESKLAAAGGESGSSQPVKAVEINGIVSLDPSLVGKVAPTDTVFVFARAANGPKMPLAIVRKTVADLPLRFVLNDAMAMSPNLKLSQFDSVVVGARVSKQGDAMARPGDLQGLTEPMAPGSKDAKIVINALVN